MKSFRSYLMILILVLVTGCQIRSKSGIVISKLSKVSKLSTVEVVLTKYVYDVEELRNWWNKIFGKDKIFLSRTEAVVKFGIDLSKIQREDIQIRGTMIEIELPPVQVTNFSYPAEDFKVDLDVTDIDAEKMNKRLVQSIDKLYQASEMEIWRRLDQLGIHKTVETRTEILVTKILENMGFDEVYISFKGREPFNPESYDKFMETFNPDDQ